MTEPSGSWQLVVGGRHSRWVLGACLVLVAALALAPAFASRSVIQDLFFIMTMLALAQYWNVLAGFAGLVSVGQQAFVGIGAYAMFAAVILWGVDPVAAIPLAGLAALLFAVPTAYFTSRLHGAYFAIGTWVIAEVARLLAGQFKQLGGGTGTSLPREATRDIWLVDTIRALFDVRAPAARDIIAYWLALLLAVVTIAVIYYVLRHRRGLSLAAIRDNEGAARSVGVDAAVLKWSVFLAVSFGTGMAGALIYLQKSRISPDAAFSVVDWTAYVIFIVVIGGIGTIEGPIIGVLVFFVLQKLFSEYGSWYLMALGAISIVIMLFSRQGLWGVIAQKSDAAIFPVNRRLVNDRENLSAKTQI